MIQTGMIQTGMIQTGMIQTGMILTKASEYSNTPYKGLGAWRLVYTLTRKPYLSAFNYDEKYMEWVPMGCGGHNE